jgi:enoyl-CoA hydratase/carnithine racemase
MAGGDVIGFKEALEKGQRADVAPSSRRACSRPRRCSCSWRACRNRLSRACKVRAAGAAVGFVAGADIAICGASSIFVVAHVNIGVSPDGSTS